MFKHLRMELMFTIFICLFASFTVFKVIDFTTNKPKLNFDDDIARMRSMAKSLASQYEGAQTIPAREISEIRGFNIAIVDDIGRVIAKTKNVHYPVVEIAQYIQDLNDEKTSEKPPLPKEHRVIYPINVADFKGYVVVSGMPQGKFVKPQTFPVLAFSISVVVFVLLFFLLTKRKIKEIEHLSQSLHNIAKGDLRHRINISSQDEIGRLANDINVMACALEEKMDQMEQMERSKNELIVSVSHDLRTPLTSVMGYLQLLLDQKSSLSVDQQKYVGIASEKSKKLKTLIDRLFEYTKLATHSVTLERQRFSFHEFVEQIIEEFRPVFEEKGITFALSLSREEMNMDADPDQLVRVFDNLLMNAASYCNQQYPVVISLTKMEGYAEFNITNHYFPVEGEDNSRLFERFYRFDSSRNADSGNSGLGLAIAKSIVDLHGGTLSATTDHDQISFSLKLPFL
jgi:signal transduction histidine kinase